MKSDYFVEFVNHELALRTEQQFKFLIDKQKQNTELINDYKLDKIKEIDVFLSILDSLEAELKVFKKLIPVLPAEAVKSVKSSVVVKNNSVVNKKRVVKKKKVVKQPLKKADKGLDNLKLGLERIRDELERM